MLYVSYILEKYKQQLKNDIFVFIYCELLSIKYFIDLPIQPYVHSILTFFTLVFIHGEVNNKVFENYWYGVISIHPVD